MNYSTTFIANIVVFLTLVLPLGGIEVVNESMLTSGVAQIVGAISVVYVFIGRFRAGGISIWGLRK